jgi:RimJ/RimL family protein N-acetyltransferase
MSTRANPGHGGMVVTTRRPVPLPIRSQPMQIDVTPKLALTPFRHDDAGSLVELLCDEQIHGTMLRMPYPYTLADAVRFLETAAKPSELNPRFAIRRQGQLIGGFGLDRGEAQWEAHAAEIGYWLGRPFWGQGIMTAVVGAAAGHAFEQLNLRRLTAGIFSPNPASARVVEKCGFVEEGLLRGKFMKGGELIDVRLFALVR